MQERERLQDLSKIDIAVIEAIGQLSLALEEGEAFRLVRGDR